MGLLDKVFKKRVESPTADEAAMGKGAFLVMDVFALSGVGVIVYGKVASGVIQREFSTEVGGRALKIKTIEKEKGEIPLASEGDLVALRFLDAKKDWFSTDQVLIFS